MLSLHLRIPKHQVHRACHHTLPAIEPNLLDLRTGAWPDPNCVASKMEIATDVSEIHSTAPNEHSPKTVTSIRCKHCNRRFATISIEDDLLPFDDQQEPCTSCEPFLSLYETLRTREKEHNALLDRGPKHHGRALAHNNYRNARVALQNVLIDIEAPNEAFLEAARPAHTGIPGSVQLEQKAEPSGASGHEDDTVNAPLQGKHALDTQYSPTMKRKVIDNGWDSKIECKRIKFNDSVEERQQYRSTLEYFRGAKEYVPGRHVAAEGSELLDTSGWTVSFAKFTGQKKVGSAFVDILPKEETDENNDATAAACTQGKGQGKKSSGKKSPNEIKKPLSEPDTVEHELSNQGARGSGGPTTPISSISAATERPLQVAARLDRQDGGSSDCPPIESFPIVKPRVPGLARADNVAVGETSDRATTPASKIQQSVETNLTFANENTTEGANIRSILANIQRDLSQPLRATTSPPDKERIRAAVHASFEFLEPLNSLCSAESNLLNGSEEPQEEDSVYYESFDTSDRQIPTVAQGNSSSPRAQISTTDEARTTDSSLALEIGAPFEASIQGRQVQQADGPQDVSRHNSEQSPLPISILDPDDLVRAATVSKLDVVEHAATTVEPLPINDVLRAVSNTTNRDQLVSTPQEPAFLVQPRSEASPIYLAHVTVEVTESASPTLDRPMDV